MRSEPEPGTSSTKGTSPGSWPAVARELAQVEVQRQRRAGEEELRQSEERFRLIAEHAHDLIALLDKEGRFHYLSPSWESALGYPAGALLGTVALELIHPDDWPEGATLGRRQAPRAAASEGRWELALGRRLELRGRGAADRVAVRGDRARHQRAQAGGGSPRSARG